MKLTKIISNNPTNSGFFLAELDIFLKENPTITDTFRYYKTRSFDCIQNHLYTALYFINDTCVGYGHLDNDHDVVWLGIAVTASEHGKGIGSQIMNDLLKECSTQITLSVDIDNIKAINLYKKFNFTVVDKNKKYIIMKN